jgi:hypothetical protein
MEQPCRPDAKYYQQYDQFKGQPRRAPLETHMFSARKPIAPFLQTPLDRFSAYRQY